MDLRIGPRTLAITLALVTTVGCCCQGMPLPLLLADDHPPYRNAILQVFGQLKHGRRRHGRGRRKNPTLKPPADLLVGVVKKLRDAKGNLLEVTSKALHGTKKQIIARIQELGIGYTINTAHIERLNGTIRSQQQARLGRRTRNVSRLTRLLQYSLWLWRDLYNWTRIHASLGMTPAMILELTQSVWSVLDYIRHPVHVSDYQLQDWAEQRNSIAKSAIEVCKRE